MLGLDIGTSSLKLVELGRKTSGQLVLQRCASEALQPGWVVDGQIQDFDEIVQALQRLLRSSACQAKQVAMALPTPAVFTKKIQLPADTQAQELHLQVETVAAEYFPFPLEECHLDYCVANPYTSSTGMLEIVIAVARSERIHILQELAQAVGLTLRVVDSESFAARQAVMRLTACLPQLQAPATLAVFTLGGESSSLQVLRAGDIVYYRDLAVGGATLTQRIAARHGCTLAQAEQQKLNPPATAQGALDLVEAHVDSLALAMSQALQVFYADTAYGPASQAGQRSQVDQVMLAGGCAALAGLPAKLMAHVHVPCARLDPFAGMALAPGLPADWVRHKASYLIASGLALRRFAP